MTRKELIEALDSLCWLARRYGHDDYGLEGFAVDIDGNAVKDDTATEGYYHGEAVRLADHFIENGVRVD